jgi:hypothetical protein
MENGEALSDLQVGKRRTFGHLQSCEEQNVPIGRHFTGKMSKFLDKEALAGCTGKTANAVCLLKNKKTCPGIRSRQFM